MWVFHLCYWLADGCGNPSSIHPNSVSILNLVKVKTFKFYSQSCRSIDFGANIDDICLLVKKVIHLFSKSAVQACSALSPSPNWSKGDLNIFSYFCLRKKSCINILWNQICNSAAVKNRTQASSVSNGRNVSPSYYSHLSGEKALWGGTVEWRRGCLLNAH